MRNGKRKWFKKTIACMLALVMIAGLWQTPVVFAQGEQPEAGIFLEQPEEVSGQPEASKKSEPDAQNLETGGTGEDDLNSQGISEEDQKETTSGIGDGSQPADIQGSGRKPQETDTPEIEENFQEEQNTENSLYSQNSLPKARISFRTVYRELDAVEIALEVNGTLRENIEYPAGLITDNLAALDQYLTGKEKFQKAILRKADGTETQISRIGTYEGNVYYSLNDQQDTGILLDVNAGDTLVLMCASQYTVTYEPGENGTVAGPETLWQGEGLEATVTAAKYHHIKSISWNDGTEHSVEVTDEDSVQVSVPAEHIVGDIIVKAEFEKDQPYTITAGQIQQGGICLNQGQEGDDYYPDGVDQPIPPAEPGSTQTFMVFSQSWTGGDEWYLNMMKINGENIKVPLDYEIGTTSEPTILSNGSQVTIKLSKKNEGLYWKDGDPSYGLFTGKFNGWDKKRCLYEVTVTDVQEDLKIDLNYKRDDKHEMIMTGLDGIAIFGAASEKYQWETHLTTTGYHYYYDVQPNDGDTVYDAYYNSGASLATAYNIYLYTVKPGYNPNTVNFEVFYNGVQMDSEEAISPKRDGSGELAWMLTVNEMAEALNTNYRHFDDFIVNANTAGYTHCFALNQNSAYNQLLRLKANPYQYHLVYNLNAGTYDGTDLDTGKYQVNADGTMTEIGEAGEAYRIYTLAKGNVSVNMPLAKPVKDGSIFKGWVLYKDGQPVSDKLYGANEAFSIDTDSIANAAGNEKLDQGHTFTFVAQWEDVAISTETAAYTIKYYKEDSNGDVEANGKKYTLYHSASDYGTVGDALVAINDRNPGNEYTLNSNSRIKIEKLMDEKEQGYEENNQIIFFYDLKAYDLTIAKDVQEDGDLTRAYEIQVILKDRDGNPAAGTYGSVEFKNGIVTVNLKDGENVVIRDIPVGYQYSVQEIETLPNGYTVTYQTNKEEAKKEHPSDVKLTANTTITVINYRQVVPDTGLTDGSMAGGLGILLAGGLALVFWFRRKGNVRG